MTTLPNREATALIVIDVQNGVVARAYDRGLLLYEGSRSTGISAGAPRLR